MPVIPPVRVSGLVPRPDGTEGDATFALGATAALTLQSTVGINSLRWEITAKPPGSAVAIGNQNPTAPFSTTFGPFDVYGTYMAKAIANNDPASVKEFAICVLTPLRSLRIPARAESDQWDGTNWWEKAVRDLYLTADGYSPSTGAPTTAVYALGAAHGSLPNARVLTSTTTIQVDTGTAGQFKFNVLEVPLASLKNAGGANGDIIYWNGSAFARLPVGAAGKVLKVVAGLPAWDTDGGGVTPVMVDLDAVSTPYPLSPARLTICYARTNVSDTDTGIILPPCATSEAGDTVIVKRITEEVDTGLTGEEAGDLVTFIQRAGSDTIDFSRTIDGLYAHHSSKIYRCDKANSRWLLVATHQAAGRIIGTVLEDSIATYNKTKKWSGNGFILNSAATHNLETITPTDNTAGSILSTVVIRRASYEAGGVGYYERTIRRSYKKVAGVVTLLGAADRNDGDPVTDGTATGFDPAYIASGGTIIIQSPGRAGETWFSRHSNELFMTRVN